jgi:hypothetical protein
MNGAWNAPYELAGVCVQRARPVSIWIIRFNAQGGFMKTMLKPVALNEKFYSVTLLHKALDALGLPVDKPVGCIPCTVFNGRSWMTVLGNIKPVRVVLVRKTHPTIGMVYEMHPTS